MILMHAGRWPADGLYTNATEQPIYVIEFDWAAGCHAHFVTSYVVHVVYISLRAYSRKL